MSGARGKAERIKARQKLLQGVDARPKLLAAAKEMASIAERNSRIAEVESQRTDYGTKTQEVWYMEERTSDGWRAYSIEDMHGQGCLDVRRPDRENLEPALRWDLAGKLVRAAVFNEARPSIEYVRDHVTFKLAGTMDGKAR
jgi:hypothetical protein